MSFRGCGFEDECAEDEICFDTNKTRGEFECMKIGMNIYILLSYQSFNLYISIFELTSKIESYSMQERYFVLMGEFR